MKKILFKKILSDCFIFFLITLISTSIIIWVFQAVNYLDIMIEDGRSFIVYTNYTLLSLPKIVSKILPFALFFSFFFVFNKYEINNELIIFWTLGINKIEFVKFFLKFSFIILLIQILLTTIFVPMTQKFSRTLIKSSNIDFFESFVKPKRFNDTINDLTIFAEDKNENGELKNLYLKKSINENEFQITYAKKGIFKNKSGTSVLMLYDGETINGENNKIINLKFSESDFGLRDFATNTITQFKIQETSTIDLFRCIINLSKERKKYLYENCSTKNLDNIYVEIMKRLLMPLYIPILVMASLLIITKPKEDLNYIKFRIVTFVIGLLIIILSEASLRFVQDELFKNLKIIIIPFIIFLISYYNYLNKFQLRFKSKKNIK
tara:strand:+ start:632 stop:1768 length:1137 start_codon:yes stop_codon:yes gene_type:complete